MNKILYFLALVFSYFPYIQIFPLETYTQPYYVFFIFFAFFLLIKFFIKCFPVIHAISLVAFAIFGFLSFLFAVNESMGVEEIKGLLQYILPLPLAGVSYFLVLKYGEHFRKLTSTAIFIWLSIAAVQFFINPLFATNLTGEWGVSSAIAVIESGRGVLSLAPEPTHFALHVFALLTLAMVLGESSIRLVIGLVLLIVFSISTTLLFTLIASALISLIRIDTFERRNLIKIAAIGGLALLGLSFLIAPRFYEVWSVIISNPMAIIALDGSANARASGLVLGSQAIFDNVFFPHGMSNAEWLVAREELIERSENFNQLSSSGVASGYLRPVYEIGFFAIPFLVLVISTLFHFPRDFVQRFFILGFLGIYFMQFLISSPLFGLVYGAVLAKGQNRTRLYFYFNTDDCKHENQRAT